ncbi:MAG: hypothetical protein UT84_C0048G0001 [Candidatus Curtissbacteria bacterium GW2011_GWA1_40_16]|uniref:Uncharacterized protein n=1 Tax=Candidatus Curtissbacteria bacterium GW2011_GWA1_40_16 TaxID=1618405 RepID=A0A0G0RE25_9BACT|nr:MAG: hypothetical protein UT84_C0048G0001 [Candidatus Curtissbacteria bacterium GW2011_GWA1_40_16]
MKKLFNVAWVAVSGGIGFIIAASLGLNDPTTTGLIMALGAAVGLILVDY